VSAARRPRGTRSDGTKGRDLYLIKRVSLMRLTYQIRLQTYAALQRGGKLILVLPHGAQIHPTLENFMLSHPHLLQIIRN